MSVRVFDDFIFGFWGNEECVVVDGESSGKFEELQQISEKLWDD
jgi:hypothetical protein